MNSVKCCILITLMLGFFFSFGVNASRKDTACVLSSGCNALSNEYTEPYCVNGSDPSIDSSVDHTDCIRASLNNDLSSMYQSTISGAKDMTLGRFETRNLIELYCTSLLGDGISGRIYYAKPSQYKDDWDWEQTFDSRQSLFVYALCSSFKDENGSPFLTKNAVLSGAFKDIDLVTVLKLKQRSEGKDLCSLVDNDDLADCDMALYATEIFSAIMKDVFKIKYAQVLHVDTAKDFDARYRDKVVDFMSGYFDMNWEYIRLKNTFPQTIDVLESNQKYYKKVLDTVKIIDNSALADMAATSKCPIMGNMTGLDFIACAFHSSQGKGFSLTPSFVSFLYNEIMHYRIFKMYIQYRIDAKLSVMSMEKQNEKDIRRFEAKALDFDGYANLQLDATKRALHSFEEFNMSYPLHIGLLLYQEKMKAFRDNHLSPAVTLFYSLSEKLQNVQLPN